MLHALVKYDKAKGSVERMLPFSLPCIRKNEIWHLAAGISLGSQTWTGDALPNNLFTKEA